MSLCKHNRYTNAYNIEIDKTKNRMRQHNRKSALFIVVIAMKGHQTGKIWLEVGMSLVRLRKPCCSWKDRSGRAKDCKETSLVLFLGWKTKAQQEESTFCRRKLPSIKRNYE